MYISSITVVSFYPWNYIYIACLIRRPIHSALCHIEAKSFVNYYIYIACGYLIHLKCSNFSLGVCGLFIETW